MNKREAKETLYRDVSWTLIGWWSFKGIADVEVILSVG